MNTIVRVRGGSESDYNSANRRQRVMAVDQGFKQPCKGGADEKIVG